ncbi:MAG TPA: winged helix-turn-helix domain-containing protein [Geothrix sp.]|jgi:DNA-binding winged helix-turn-helix (wHTH) protein/TolB-like protein/Tfp pilus assembly protein PilF
MGEAGPSARRRISFEPFEVDPDSGELLKEGLRVPLQELPFQLLCLMLERPGQVVSREEVRAALWPKGTFVDFDDGLNTAVRKLRLALGDSADHPIYIETLPKRGYRFVGEITKGNPEASESMPDSTPVFPFALSESLEVRAPEARFTGLTWDRRQALRWGVALVVAIALGGAFAWARWSAMPPARIEALAVLPLSDLTGDPAKAYIPAGLTDELTTELVKLQDLRVTSRGSLAPYASSTLPLKDLAQKLNVDVLIEGSLVRDGDRYHLLINLVRRDGRHLWGERYDSDEGGLQALQAKVALDIRRQVRPGTYVHAQRHRPKPEAYDTYLRGLYLEHHGGLNFSRKVEEAYTQAISLDPDYASPYAGLARFYLLHSVFTDEASKEEVAKGRDAASHALALDPTLADAHTALGLANFYFDWDWAGAEAHFRKALQLDPNSPDAHDALGWLFFARGRKDEGLDQLKQARDLFGYSPGSRSALAIAYIFARQPDEALKEANIALALNPDSNFVRNAAGWACYESGDFNGFMENESKLTGYTAEDLRELWVGFKAKGRTGILETFLRFAERGESRTHSQATSLAQTHASLGHREEALRWLEIAFHRREPSLVWINDQSDFDSIRGTARFKAVVHNMGLD